MQQLLISTLFCIFIFTACGTASPSSDSNGDTIADPDPTDISTGEFWSIGPTSELRMETMNNESIYFIDTWRDLEYISANFMTTPDLLTYTYHITNNIRFPNLKDSAIPTTPEARIDTEYESFYVDNNGLIPIGSDGNPFTGSFDGSYGSNSHSIADLVITQPNQTNVALFGVIGSDSTGATLKNIHLKNITVIGDQKVGGLVGSVLGENIIVENNSAQGSISAEGNNSGGLIGYIDSTRVDIENSYTSGSIEANNNSGGLIGFISSSMNITIKNNYSSSMVTSRSTASGGFIGYIDTSDNVVITKNYASGDVTSQKGASGGFLGISSSLMTNSTISNNYASGNIETTSGTAGGFVGDFYINGSNVLTSNYARGAVTRTGVTGDPAGGFIGALYTSNPPIAYNYWDQEAQHSPGVSYGIGSLTSNTGATPLQASPQKSDFQTWNFDGEGAVWVWNEGSWPTLAWEDES